MAFKGEICKLLSVINSGIALVGGLSARWQICGSKFINLINY